MTRYPGSPMLQGPHRTHHHLPVSLLCTYNTFAECFAAQHFNPGAERMQRKHGDKTKMTGMAWGKVHLQKHMLKGQKLLSIHPQRSSSHCTVAGKGPAVLTAPRWCHPSCIPVFPVHRSVGSTAAQNDFSPFVTGEHIQQPKSSWYFVLAVNRITGSSEKWSSLPNNTLGMAAAFQPRTANTILPKLSVLMGPIFSIGEKKAGRKFHFYAYKSPTDAHVLNCSNSH